MDARNAHKAKKRPVSRKKGALLGIKTAKKWLNTHFGQNEYSAHMYAHSKTLAVTAGALLPIYRRSAHDNEKCRYARPPYGRPGGLFR